MTSTDRRRQISRLYHELMRDGPDPEALVGRAIGPYTVLSLLGSGGMGDVYRARDRRLGRDVALKILPGLVGLDDDGRTRVRREAQLLASLNHPHIAQIYGVEESDGVTALVLELVEGATLAEVIAAGPMPSAEAARIAHQIALALEAAHHRGIVHRDLKPANITLRRDGTVKVLDFGLAKALAPDGEMPSTSMLTAGGVMLGTAAYMAPEQARGQASDPRVDVWAFGVVLYEMLTGRSPFAGETLADTLGAVLHREPDWHGLPWALKPLVQLCLEKQPERRLRSMTEARHWLEETPRPERDARGRGVWGMRILAAACLALAAGVSVVHFREPAAAVASAATPHTLRVSAPPGTNVGSYLTLSPDGRQLAFLAVERGGAAIWVHALDWGESRRLVEPAGYSGSSLIWSPDGRFVGYVARDGTLTKIAVEGGTPQPIARVAGGWGGAAWNDDGTIVFGSARGGLMRVSDRGGEVTPVTLLDRARGEVGHGAPRLLPDGRHFIYARASMRAGASGLYVGRIDAPPAGQPREPFLASESRAVYAPSRDPRRGHILLVTNNVLVAYPFDARALALAGEPVTLVEGVGAVNSGGGVLIASVSASRTGVLAYAAVPRGPETGIAVVYNWMQLLKPAAAGGVPPRIVARR